MTKRLGRVFLVFAALGLLPVAAFADEIVHFTNGAEMPVRSHTVEKDKEMVRLDLGGNSFIAFPMSMVDKIVSAGHDVFLNPGFHPSNQAIAGISGAAIADTTLRGGGDPVGFVRRPVAKGTAGVMLGEAADAIPAGSIGGPQLDQTMVNSRRRFNPAFPPAPGSPPQVIMPPSQVNKAPVQMTLIAKPPPAEPPPPPQDTPSDPPSEDPPDQP